MQRLALALFFIFNSFAPHALWADASCTVIVNNAAGLAASLSLAPGAVLCLHGGLYPVAQLQLLASGSAAAPITLRSYSGEQAELQAVGAGGVLKVQGAYWIVENVLLDNNGLSSATLTVGPTSDHFQLLGSEVRNGSYYGVDIFGANTTLVGNTIHNYQPPNQDNGNEIHCMITHSSASGLVVRSNLIYDCWGDGIQIYEPDVYKNPAQYVHNVLIEQNTFRRGTLAYSSNAIDIKGVVSAIIRNNDIGGFYLPSGVLKHPDQMAVELHHGAIDVRVTGNVIHDNWEGIDVASTVGGQWVGTVIENNLIINSQNYAIALQGLYSGGVVRNNTIVAAQTNGINIGGQGLAGSTLDHNLFYDSGLAWCAAGTSLQSTIIGPNAWYDTWHMTDYSSRQDVVGTGDPGFVDLAHGNYALKPNSPASGFGANVAAIRALAPSVGPHQLYLPLISQTPRPPPNRQCGP